MGTRFHVRIAATTLIPVLASGCIFGGGDKKPAVQAAQAARAPQQAAIVASPLDSAESSADEMRKMELQAREQARREALAKALSPQESEVQWPGSDELRLGDHTAAPTPTPQPDPFASAELQRDASRVTVQSSQTHDMRLAAPAEATHAASAEVRVPEPAAPAKAAVANGGLDLSGATDDSHAQPAAAAPVAPAVDKTIAKDAAQTGELAQRIAQRLRDNPSDLSAQLDHQLLRYLQNETVPDLNTISNLSTEDRELLTALLDGLTNFRNGLRADNNLLLSHKVRPLLDLAGRLRSQAELSIPTIALCKKMDGFGLYEPIEPRFLAGVKNAAIVYCEVANVSSQQNEQGVWESKLSQEAVLYSEQGRRIWTSSRQTVPDRSRNRRQDFCIAQVITLPANLPIDRYILKVTVMDEQVKRVAEATMPVELVAQLQPGVIEQAEPRLTGKTPETRSPAQPASDRQSINAPALDRQLGEAPAGSAGLEARDGQ